MHAESDRSVYESPLAFNVERVGAAAMYCSDGRYGEQFDDLLHNVLQLPRYDRMALPGGPACLAGRFGSFFEEQGTAQQVEFLIRSHELRRVVLIAHQDCGHYLQRLRISPDQVEPRQHEDLAAAARRIRSFGCDVQVEAFFARKVGNRVCFEPVEC
jgi:hypothetical protein